jgi:hypothetical protein
MDVIRATPGAAPPSLRTSVRTLPWLCRAGVVAIVGGALFDLACHALDQIGGRSLTTEEYVGHVFVLVGMVVALVGVWSIPFQRRGTRQRKETT